MDSFKMIRLLSPTLLLGLVALALGLPMAFSQQDGKGRQSVESPACHCQSITLDFEKEVQTQPPREFVFSPSFEAERHEWRVESDRSNQVLVRKLFQSDDRHVSLAIVDKPEALAVSLSIRIKSVDGKEDKNGGLVWRYADPKNYLLARLDISDKRVRLYRVVNGNRIKFGEETDLPLSVDTWYTLRVEHRRDKIKVYLDNEAIIIEKETHFHKAGRVGLYVNEDAQTSFDDFEVTAMGEVK